MKYVLTICAFALLFAATSCKDDDMCDSLNDAVVGEWDVNIIGGLQGDAIFNGDGTFIEEPQGLFLDTMFQGLTVNSITYAINGQTIELTGVDTLAPGATTQTNIEITSFNCDEMTGEETDLGTINFKRK